jgi:cation diffusion facilitator CzcD-associated flavoprotein CzcO
MDADLDVLIVGAGLSGIGAACHLQRRLPGKRYAIVEARDAIGGTWDLFRYPGVRSDSDMFTLGYSFRPWIGSRALAGGDEIREYIRATAREYGVERRIRYGHRVVSAAWSSQAARWTVTCERPGGEQVELRCRFLHFCSGYYRYDEGYAPSFAGSDRFRGPIVHPQHWPEELDYSGKRVVVIGSGATAVTLVPALAREAEHVVMLQRSPSYVLSLPTEDPIAAALGRRLSARLTARLVRLKDISLTALTYTLCRRAPERAAQILRRAAERQLPPGYDVDRHFTPRYAPWDQRLCIAANGDLFRAIRAGTASIVTDRVEAFTETGIRLAGGEELPADIVVTATGLNVELLGGARVLVDGAEVDPGTTVAYKGMMMSGVPNAALSVGYTNASWTLKCDLICEYVCRLLAHMDKHGYDRCIPLEPDRELARVPLLDFTSGYVLRARDRLPAQAERAPWRLHQNWFVDRRLFLRGPLDGEGIRFAGPAAAPSPAMRAGDDELQSPGCRSRNRFVAASLTPFATTLRFVRSRSRPG